MIAKLKGTIKTMRRVTVDGAEWVEVDIGLTGALIDNRVAGKEVFAECTLHIKPVYAAELRFGQPHGEAPVLRLEPGCVVQLAFELDTDPDRLPTR